MLWQVFHSSFLLFRLTLSLFEPTDELSVVGHNDKVNISDLFDEEGAYIMFHVEKIVPDCISDRISFRRIFVYPSILCLIFA